MRCDLPDPTPPHVPSIPHAAAGARATPASPGHSSDGLRVKASDIAHRLIPASPGLCGAPRPVSLAAVGPSCSPPSAGSPRRPAPRPLAVSRSGVACLHAARRLRGSAPALRASIGRGARGVVGRGRAPAGGRAGAPPTYDRAARCLGAPISGGRFLLRPRSATGYAGLRRTSRGPARSTRPSNMC